MGIAPQFTKTQLEGMVRSDPERVVLHAFRTIELRIRDLMKLDDAPISAIFDRAYGERLIGDLLYHQLRTLKRLRNNVMHDGHAADLGDAMTALGTLYNFDKVFEETRMPGPEMQAGGVPSLAAPLAACRLSKFDRAPLGTEGVIPKRHDWREFQEIARRFFEEEAACTLAEEVAIELPSGQHRFDLASLDRNMVIECKSYTWTKSGKRPSAKWEAAQRACTLLAETKAERRILVFQDHVMNGKSLAQEFVRLNPRLIADIDIWRHINGSFERLHEQSKFG